MTIPMHFLFTYIAVFILVLSNVNTYNLYSRANDMMSNYTNFTWVECSGPTDPLHFHSFFLLPDPFKVPGNLTMNTMVSLKTALPSDLNLALTVEKKVAGFYVKVPCISDVGSCTYSDACSRWTNVCPKDLGQNNIPCSCPIPPNNYTVNNIPIFINASRVPEYQGDYRVTGNLSSPSLGYIGCVKFNLSVIVEDH